MRRRGAAALPAALCLLVAPAAGAAPWPQEPPPAAGAAAAEAAEEASPIGVTVNGAPVAFGDQGPVQRFGTVLVPLRGVFERLGASVRFDAGTKTILALRGATTVSLRLGEVRALVNGEERALSVPAQAVGNGTTLVPLRFVSEALGAQVRWDAASRTVGITTGAARAAGLPAAPGTQPVSGTITGIFPETGTLTVRSGGARGGQNTRIPLAPDAAVLVKGAGDGPAIRAALGALRAGDQVTVRRDAQGRATRVEAVYGEKAGEVKSVRRSEASAGAAVVVLTLTDGTSIEMAPDVPVTMAGRAVSFADIRPGERVVVRVNPQTGRGIGVAVVTADEPAPAPPARAEVTSVDVAVGGGPRPILRAGDVLSVTLQGTPGGTASFSIPGVEGAQNVALAETGAGTGTYVGTFAIPKGTSVRGATLVGSLRVGETAAPVATAREPLVIDADEPRLANLSPPTDASLPPGRPLIYGTYADAGSGIDPAGTRVVVNNRDVTAQATITEAFFSFRPAADLPAGRNVVRVTVRDGAGNEAQQEWSFAVGEAPPRVKRLTVTPSQPPGRPLGVGDRLTVRLEAEPGGAARLSIGAVVRDRPMPEEPAGVYTATYTVARGDSLAKAPVTVAFTPAGSGGDTITQIAPQSVTIAAGAPEPPIIDSPQEGAAVGGGPFRVAGRAAPGAKVRLSLSYQGRLLVIPTRGTVSDNLEATADAEGQWSVEEIKADAPPGVSGLTFVLRAFTVDAAGDRSEPVTVRFKR